MSLRILVVEDNAANLSLMEYLLRAYGHTVSTATNGEQGLAMARRDPPDVILMDLQMPGMDGFEAAQHLKGDPLLQRIPLVAVTALAMVGDREKILTAGFDGYLAKPIEPETFVGQVERFHTESSRPSAPVPTVRTPEAPSTPAPQRASAKTILVVDDTLANLKLSRNILESLGFNVVTASTVEEGLRVALEAPPDLILSDVHIGRRTGFDLLSGVRDDERLRRIPFLFITSTVKGTPERVMALGLGAADFIERPIAPEEFIERVTRWIHVDAAAEPASPPGREETREGP